MPYYKFLASGARTPFSGVTWPQPAGGPGAWVGPRDRAADAPGGSRVCRVDDLPHWIAEELWVVEVDGARSEGEVEVVAEQVRLVLRVDGWTSNTARALAADAAWRARDAVAARLAANDALDAAAELHAVTTLADLATRANVLAERTPAWADQLGLIGEVGHEAEHAWVATALQTAVVAIAGWDGAAQSVERGWQARWLAERLAIAN